MFNGLCMHLCTLLCLIAWLHPLSSAQHLRILVLLPQTQGSFKFAFGAEMSGGAVTIAVEDIVAQGLLSGQTFTVDYSNTACNPVQGIGITAAKLEQYNYTALIGPQCSGVCDVVSKLAAYRNIPIFSGVCQDRLMQDKGVFKTLTRFLGSFNMIGQAVTELMGYHGWKRFGIISEIHQDRVWILSRNGILEEAENNNITVSISRDVGIGQEDSLEDILREVATVSRIIVLAVRGPTLRSLMLLAHQLGYTNGEYFFIDIYYYRAETVFGEFSWKMNDQYDGIAREAYKSLLFISYYTPLTQAYDDFQAKVKLKSLELFNYTYAETSSIPYPAANLYEAMWTLAVSINETLRDGGDITNGTLLSRRLWGRSINGTTGQVTLNSNGDREQGYSIFQLNQSDVFSFRLVGYFFSHRGYFFPVEGSPILWPSGGSKPPLDTPTCGYDNELCYQGLTDRERLNITLAALLGCLGLVIAIAAVTVWIVMRYTKNKANEMVWRVRLADVTFSNKSGLSFTRSVISLRTMQSNHSVEQIFTKTGFYKGGLVAVKNYSHVTQSYIGNSIKEYRQLKELSHPNVCRIMGISIDVPDTFVLTEYCSKGSLEDILENDSITLDFTFRYSLICDILKGLTYIHDSHIKYHGNLKSLNCLVDGRFVVKLTDFGPRNWISSKPRMDKDLLWTAPEILRSQVITNNCTVNVKGDLYSLGIILQEIVCRCGVFYINSDDFTPTEIIKRLVSPNGRILRPSVDAKSCPTELKQLIEICWDEDPNSRPSLKHVTHKVKEIAGDKFVSGNIFDNLLARMEQYANNLESLVDERTGKYLQEKKRAEDLLCRLLPASIAKEIQERGIVDPVSFEFVTICFTDIVGFTSISAASTPLQIVAMLNDLYSRFDDVIDEFDAYKVETIGDAYMVVSGLPTVNNNHVTVMASLAVELISTAKVFRIRHFPDKPLLLRAGLHTGPCVAGVVGLKMPRYCLFGDTVNTASRMESTGEALKIHVSDVTANALVNNPNFHLEKRGEVAVKGKGDMTTYWLEATKKRNKPISL